MEGSKRRSDWIPNVERSFEWTRLEDELLATAYERALPMIQRATVDKRPASRSGDGNKIMDATANHAVGA